jgi:hypothetical protein
MNMPNTIEWTVDDWQPPRKMAISGTGMAGALVTITLTVEPAGTGSTLTVASSFEGQMIAGAIERAISTELDTSLANLAKLVA